QRQDLESVARQLEIADDLRTQQAHDIREHREPEPWKDFLRHGSTANQRTPFEDKRPATGAREVRSRNEPVVPAANDDDVVAIRVHARFRGGSKNGSGRMTASAN